MSRNTTRRKKKTVNRGSKKTISKKLFEDALSFFNSKYSNDVTRNAYLRNMKRYIDFCRSKYQVKTKDELKEHLQDYVVYLKMQGKTASTIHTYLAPCCVYLGVSMKEIEKPKRKVSENIRSRSCKKKSKYSLGYREDDRLALFQQKCGLRRRELARITQSSLVKDESGNFCIAVKGKGGKFQLQKILEPDIPFILSYFTKSDSGEKLFKKSEFSSTDYHKMRSEHAKNCYAYYMSLLHSGDEKKDAENAYKLRGELLRRWNKFNINKKTGIPKSFPMADTYGTYKLRGDNRRFAIANSLPVEYDRLAVYMVSVFHLSHWRLDTLTNYLLNV